MSGVEEGVKGAVVKVVQTRGMQRSSWSGKLLVKDQVRRRLVIGIRRVLGNLKPLRLHVELDSLLILLEGGEIYSFAPALPRDVFCPLHEQSSDASSLELVTDLQLVYVEARLLIFSNESVVYEADELCGIRRISMCLLVANRFNAWGSAKKQVRGFHNYEV
eukprot:CAMPEP_0196654344 /NCGR_PEP_ID=MMETSP1086-20130531/4054_1 /TAXON_ID=77921 /ORGANISM="Cyanoptyche  gloeocystis , Strain SAG4.97" /LENGTH=161 /DNA_ID=CAMNT_0041986045 /DNA_START=179 /DNA_END=664 /DNA_ORIENTATION=+